MMRILSVIVAILVMTVLFLASGVLVATPALAAEPLNWEMKVDAPSGVPGVAILQPGSNIMDYDFDSSGMTMYAVGYWDEVPFGMLSEGFTGGADGQPENFAFIYVDQDGIPGNTGWVRIPENASAGPPPGIATVTLASGDTGDLE